MQHGSGISVCGFDAVNLCVFKLVVICCFKPNSRFHSECGFISLSLENLREVRLRDFLLAKLLMFFSIFYRFQLSKSVNIHAFAGAQNTKNG